MIRVYVHSLHEKSGGVWLTPLRYSKKGFKWQIKAWFRAELSCGTVEKTHFTISPKSRCGASDLSGFVADFWQESIEEYNNRNAVDMDFGFTATAR